jgi:hypothetical protein
MKLAKLGWIVAACAVMIITGITVSPRAAIAAVRGALVELVLPSRPFNESFSLSPAGSAGPGTSGVLGVTAITLTNFSASNTTVFVFNPLFASGSSCGSPVIGGSGPRFYVDVPAGQTVHLTYPSPLVFTPISGNSCIAASGSLDVDFTVNGFVN